MRTESLIERNFWRSSIIVANKWTLKCCLSTLTHSSLKKLLFHGSMRCFPKISLIEKFSSNPNQRITDLSIGDKINQSSDKPWSDKFSYDFSWILIKIMYSNKIKQNKIKSSKRTIKSIWSNESKIKIDQISLSPNHSIHYMILNMYEKQSRNTNRSSDTIASFLLKTYEILEVVSLLSPSIPSTKGPSHGIKVMSDLLYTMWRHSLDKSFPNISGTPTSPPLFVKYFFGKISSTCMIFTK